jgi:hypothetical protein
MGARHEERSMRGGQPHMQFSERLATGEAFNVQQLYNMHGAWA